MWIKINDTLVNLRWCSSIERDETKVVFEMGHEALEGIPRTIVLECKSEEEATGYIEAIADLVSAFVLEGDETAS